MAFMINTLITTAVAEETKATTAANEVISPWEVSLEFGYVATSGNNETTATNGRFNVSYEIGKWKHEGYAAIQTYETEDNNPDPLIDNSSSTENYNAEVKSNYQFSQRTYGFGVIDYHKIDNTGLDFQSSMVAGVGYQIIKTPNKTHRLDGELGYGARRSRLSEPPVSGSSRDTETVILVGVTYKWNISENAKFEQLNSREIADDNTITSSLTSLTANLVKNLAMKFSYEIRHQSDVPSPEIEKKDTVTSYTVVYTF